MPSPGLLALLLVGTLTASAATEPVVLPLWPEGVPGLRPDATPEVRQTSGLIGNIHEPTLTVFPAPAELANGTAMVVCPGGGYSVVSFEKEGIEIARWLNAQGITCFVLKYRLKEYGHPAPLRDVLRAIRLVRSRAPEFGIAPDRIGVFGSSAGGHLAACAGTLYALPDGQTGHALDAVSARPDFLVLLYPVILTDGPKHHAGSRTNLLGTQPTPAMLVQFSVDRQVNAQTPPSFLVTTLQDKTVPAENAIAFALAARAAGVPAELHVYQKGPHGFGLRASQGSPADWPNACIEWLRSNGWLTRR